MLDHGLATSSSYGPGALVQIQGQSSSTRDQSKCHVLCSHLTKTSPDTLDTLGVASGSNFPREIVTMYGDLFLVMSEITLDSIDRQN